MMHQSTRKSLGYGPSVIAAAVVLLVASCGSSGPSQGGLVPINTAGTEAREATIPPWTDSGSSLVMATEFNKFREQAFGDSLSSLTPSNILYTVAARHAGYLDSINSSAGATGPEADNIPLDSSYRSLFGEGVSPRIPSVQFPRITPIDDVWPAFFTSNDLRRRVLAVIGGRSFLQVGSGSTQLYENYWIENAGVLLTNDGELSDFRAVARPQFGILDVAAAESMWHHPFARIPLMRPSVKYVGAATKHDARSVNSEITPPFPLFNEGFGGVMTMLEERSPVTVTRSSFWPTEGQTAVSPWGFDGPRPGHEHPHYSGPILHFTMPTTEPLTELNMSLRRVDAEGSDVEVAENILNASSDPTDSFVPMYVYGAPGTPAPLELGGSSFEVVLGDPTEFFFGAGGEGGIAGGGGQILETYLTGVSIAEIYNAQAVPPPTSTWPGIPRFWIVIPSLPPGLNYNTHPFGPGNTWILFESPLNPEVLPGDFIQIPEYDDPTVPGANPGTNITDRRQILDISTDRTVMIVEKIAGGKDELNPETNVEGPAFNGGFNTPAVANFLRPVDTDGDSGLAALRNGEIMMIPADPLVPGGWYRLQVYARTTAGGTDFDNETGDRTGKVWWFQVANKTIPEAIVP